MGPSAQSDRFYPIQLCILVHFSQLVPKNLVLKLLLRSQVRCDVYVAKLTRSRIFT